MLHTIKPARGSRFRAKRIARGNSGKGGTTAGRGTKGQQARVGKGRHFGFEGGQTPLLRRQPKLGGFIRPRRLDFEVINLRDIEQKLAAGTYSIDALRKARLVRTKRPVKLLGAGSVHKKFVLSVHAVSSSARVAIEKAGGSLAIIPVEQAVSQAAQ